MGHSATLGARKSEARYGCTSTWDGSPGIRNRGMSSRPPYAYARTGSTCYYHGEARRPQTREREKSVPKPVFNPKAKDCWYDELRGGFTPRFFDFDFAEFNKSKAIKTAPKKGSHLSRASLGF